LLEHISATEHINNRKETCQSTNLVSFVPETTENAWQFFAHP